MTQSMQDLSEDEDSPLHAMSVVDIHNAMDGAEQAFDVGSQIANTLSTTSGSGAAESSHVNAVADQLMHMLCDEDAEEEPHTDSDEAMRTESQRRMRYMKSEMCECSDPEEWMVYHHGDGESDESTPWSGHHH